MNKNYVHVVAMIVAGLAMCFAGCGEVETGDSSSGTGLAPPPPAPSKATSEEAPAVPQQPMPPGSAADDPHPGHGVAGDSQPSSGEAENTESKVAEPGVGKKGRYNSNDYVSTVVGAYFGIQEKLAFDLAKSHLQRYKTIHGDYPKTHEEYMEKIIAANNVQLPELKKGEEYYYDYESAKRTRGDEALFVVSPK